MSRRPWGGRPTRGEPDLSNSAEYGKLMEDLVTDKQAVEQYEARSLGAIPYCT